MECYPPSLKNDLARTIWTSDPAHRLLSLVISPHLLHFIISTSIFFQLDSFEGVATAIPWKNWGPSNSRIFDTLCFDVCGNRVLSFIPTTVETVHDDDRGVHRLHMLDFSPSAVKYRQGLGRVVIEPSTVDLEGELVTTFLPYVDVSCKWFQQPIAVWFDKDRIYILYDEDSDTESPVLPCPKDVRAHFSSTA